MRQKKSDYTKFALTYYLVVFIPLLMIIVGAFFIQTHQAAKRLENTMAEYCARETTYWQDQMKVMNSYISDCKRNKIYYPEYSGDPRIASMEITWDLMEKEAEFPFVSGIYFVRERGGEIITAHGIYSNEGFVKNLIDIEERLRDGKSRGLYAYGHQVGQSGSRVVIFTPIEIGEKAQDRQYLTFTISEQDIRSQFAVGSVAKQHVTELYYKDDLIYSDSNVDTQLNRYSIYRSDLGNGFWILHKIPDTEKMDSIFLYQRGFSIMAVFTLMVGLYLAQRCSKKRYGTLQSIIASKESLETERNVLRQENCLYEVLNQRIRPKDELWTRCMENNIQLDRKYKFFIFMPEGCHNARISSWLREWTECEDPNTLAYGVRIHEQLTAYLVCSDADRKELEKQITFINNTAEASAGGICEDITKLRRAYREARKIYYHTTGTVKIDPTVELQAFQEALEMGDWQKSETLLENILEFLPELDGRTLIGFVNELLRVVDSDMNVTYDRMNGNVSIDLVEFQESAKRQFREKVRRMMEAEAQAAAQAPREEEERPKRNIVDVLFYIQEHYLEDDFSIKQMSASFETTPSNLGHFFKKQMGTSLAQYIEGLKMDKAKELLKNEDMKIVEIAACLGYRNSTAFIEVFKRREGLTPGMYRKNL